MDFLYRDTHLSHNINTIFEGEYYPLLGCTNDMLFAMCIEVQTADAATYFFVT